MSDPKKLSGAEFAAKIKDKYPQYADVDDADLVNRIVDKYPQYREQIDSNFFLPDQKDSTSPVEDTDAASGDQTRDGVSESARPLDLTQGDQTTPMQFDLPEQQAQPKALQDFNRDVLENIKTMTPDGEMIPQQEAMVRKEQREAQQKELDKVVAETSKETIDAIRTHAEEYYNESKSAYEKILKEGDSIRAAIESGAEITREEVEEFIARGTEVEDNFNSANIAKQQAEVFDYLKKSQTGTFGGAFRNQLVGGEGSIMAGTTRFAARLMSQILPISPEQASGEVTRDEALAKFDEEFTRKTLKEDFENIEGLGGMPALKSKETTDEYIERKIEEGGLSGTALVVGYSLPMITGGAASMMLGYADAGYEMVNNAPGADQLSQSEKEIYASVYGIIAGTLEKIGLQATLGAGKGGRFANEVITRLLTQGGKITPGRVTTMAAILARGYGSEALITGSQEGVAFGMEAITNSLKNEEIFPKEGWAEFIDRTLHSAGIGGRAGMLMAGVGGVTQMALNPKRNPITGQLYENAESVMNEGAFANIENILQAKLEEGSITEQTADRVRSDIQSFINVRSQIPDGLNVNQRINAHALILEKGNLEAKIEGKDKSLVEPELQRIDEINNELKALRQAESVTEEVKVQPDETVEEVSVEPDVKIQESEVFDILKKSDIEEASAEEKIAEYDRKLAEERTGRKDLTPDEVDDIVIEMIRDGSYVEASDLYAERDASYIKATTFLSQKVSESVPKSVAKKVLDILGIDPTAPASMQSRRLESLGNDIKRKSDRLSGRLQRSIGEIRAEEMGVDYDMALSPSTSGWSKAQRDAFIEENRRIAESAINSVIDATMLISGLREPSTTQSIEAQFDAEIETATEETLNEINETYEGLEAEGRKDSPESVTEEVKVQPDETVEEVRVEADQAVSFEYANESETPSQLRGVEPINRAEIQIGKNKKIRLTFSGQQLIDAGLAKPSTGAQLTIDFDAEIETATEETLNEINETYEGLEAEADVAATEGEIQADEATQAQQESEAPRRNVGLEIAEENLPNVNEVGSESEIAVTDGVSAKVKSIELPDGERAYSVEIYKDGELVTDKNGDTEIEFFADEAPALIDHLNKKQRGFLLSKQPKAPKQKAPAETAGEIKEGTRITFDVFGEPKTGTMGRGGSVRALDGKLYVAPMVSNIKADTSKPKPTPPKSRQVGAKEGAKQEVSESTRQKSGEQTKKQTNVQAKKAETKTKEVEDFKSALTKGTESAEKFLTDLEAQLDEFTKGTLGTNPLAPLAKIAIQAAKVAIQTTNKISEVIDAAINAVRNSDAYKELTAKEQTEIDKGVRKMFSSPRKTFVNVVKEAMAGGLTEAQAVRQGWAEYTQAVIEPLRKALRDARVEMKDAVKKAKGDAAETAKALQDARINMGEIINSTFDSAGGKGFISGSIAKAIATARTEKQIDSVLDRVDKMTSKTLEKEYKAAKVRTVKDIKSMLNPKSWIRKGPTDKIAKTRITGESKELLKKIREQYDGKDLNEIPDLELSKLQETLFSIIQEGKKGAREAAKLATEQRRNLKNKLSSVIADKANSKRPIGTREAAIASLKRGNLIEVDGQIFSNVKGFESVFPMGTMMSGSEVIVPATPPIKSRRIFGAFFAGQAYFDYLQMMMTDNASKRFITENFYDPVVKKFRDMVDYRRRGIDKHTSVKKEIFGSNRAARKALNKQSDIQLTDANGIPVNEGRLTNADMVYIYNAVRMSSSIPKFLKANLSLGNLAQAVDYVKSNPNLSKYAESLTEMYAQSLPEINAPLTRNGFSEIEQKKTVGFEELSKSLGVDGARAYMEMLNKIYDGKIPEFEVYSPTSVLGSEMGSLQESNMFNASGDATLSVISNNAIAKTAGGAMKIMSASAMFENYNASMANMVSSIDLYRNLRAAFSQGNMSMLQGIYGKEFVNNFKKDLNDIMLGRNSSVISDNTHRAVYRWINRSSAVQMFLNTRSAVFQTISLPNNIFKAMEFGLGAEYMKNAAQIGSERMRDATREVGNIPWVRDRVLQNASNIELAEIAQTDGGYQRLLDRILSEGYVLTKYADVIPVILGGAPLYAARVEQLTKQYSQEMSQSDAVAKAKDQASLDLYEATQNSQQSSEQFQMSREQKNPFTRLVLTFASVSLQYSRIQLRAGRDIINGRGSLSANVATILYYGVVQNAIFSLLSRGLGALYPDDDEDGVNARKAWASVTNSYVNTALKGLGLYGAIAAGMKDVLYDAALKISQNKIKQEEDPYDKEFYQDIINLLTVEGEEPTPKSNQALVLQSIGYFSPTVGIKATSALGAYGSAARGDYHRAMSKATQVTTNIPTDRVWGIAEQVSDAISEDLTDAERMLRMLNILTAYEMRQRQAAKEKSEGAGAEMNLNFKLDTKIKPMNQSLSKPIKVNKVKLNKVKSD